jgi:phenylalanyl-tRNA synthetase beta chain
MKFTLSWLKRHLQTDAKLDAIVATLTKIGLEVERVSDPAASLKDFVVATIIEAKLHPNADRLRVCLVDHGGEKPVQVVCGAANARTGLKSVFAAPGAHIPGKQMTLGKGVIRGVESNGMLVSGAELELSQDREGILELPQDAPVGAGFAQWAGLDDPVIEIDVTPNRPDAMGVAGIARDLAAAGTGDLITPRVTPVSGSFPCPVGVKLDLAPGDRHLAPAFALRLVRGVKNGSSPAWMQRLLTAVGLRPINALVDVTNFLTFDRARPLHVFDASKIRGDLCVRRARSGESLLALDGKTYALDEETVVIADQAGVQSIAGIIGGAASGCTEETTEVRIESALWDPRNIARSGRRLGITSDARYRFERGVDPAFCLPGIEYATKLVLEFCGGAASEVVVTGHVPETKTRLTFPWSEMRRLTGADLPISEMTGILEHLGFGLANVVGNSDLVVVEAPSWRPDIEGKADLVEEILRIAGLERVPAEPLPADETMVATPVLDPLQRRTGTAKRALAANGMLESVCWSFISHQQAVLFGGGDAALVLANPIAADLSDLRPSLLPGLVAAAQRNADRGFPDVALFEVGQIFEGTEPADQKISAAGVRHGRARLAAGGRHWPAGEANTDLFDAKADALALLGALGAPLGGLAIVPGGAPWFHPGRSGALQFKPKNVVGYFGELHPRVLDAFGIAAPVVAFELRLDDIPAPKSKATKAKPKLELSEFMPVERDFAFLVDRDVNAAEIVNAAHAANRVLVADVAVFDVYEGKGIPAGKKSVAVAVTLQPRDHTLTEAEIGAVAARIVAEVGAKTGAILRG